jgi:hypothetical protein
MFPFEDYSINLGMLKYIRAIPTKEHYRVVIVMYDGDDLVFDGEQGDRFVKRARAAGWLDPAPVTPIDGLYVPDSPLKTISQRGG